MKTFNLDSEYIQLDQLLKVLNIASSGGVAHQLVDEGLVKVNGFIETRRRAKIRVGDKVEFQGTVIQVNGKSELED